MNHLNKVYDNITIRDHNKLCLNQKGLNIEDRLRLKLIEKKAKCFGWHEWQRIKQLSVSDWHLIWTAGYYCIIMPLIILRIFQEKHSLQMELL